ncbi:MAG: gamma-glutamyltranspeptidase/glutathione hydrolase, partial [Saprospiraceae bacterium]
MKYNTYHSQYLARFVFGLLLFSTIGCQQSIDITSTDIQPYDIQQSAIFDSAAVVSAHPLASEIGKNILQQGGNAIDATVAVHFALAVVCPRAGNIGGGGFMIVRTAAGESAALDYREKAPAAATTDMYLDSLGNVIADISRKGHLAVGVPGTVDGMIKAHARFGKIKRFGDLVAPAIKLATEGYQISKAEADRLNEYQEAFRKFQSDTSPFLKKEGWKSGDLLVQKDLGNTLQRIENQGRAGFYAGKTAD